MPAATSNSHSKQMASEWARCADFNDQYPVGTPVVYRPVMNSDRGELETVTRSVAWTLPCGQAVVMVEGKAGGVSLDHVTVVGG